MLPYRFFLAEDDLDDRDFFRDGLLASGVDMTLLSHYETGKEVLEQLERHGNLLPDFIILDQNMPVMTGEQALQEIKADPRYSRIPVVIYSTSIIGNDILRLIKKGALCVEEKPGNFYSYKEMIDRIMSQVDIRIGLNAKLAA